MDAHWKIFAYRVEYQTLYLPICYFSFFINVSFINMSENEKKEKISVLNLTWRDADQLKNFTTETGKILPRKITRLTAMEQRHLTKIVKQARNFLLMP